MSMISAMPVLPRLTEKSAQAGGEGVETRATQSNSIPFVQILATVAGEGGGVKVQGSAAAAPPKETCEEGACGDASAIAGSIAAVAISAPLARMTASPGELVEGVVGAQAIAVAVQRLVNGAASIEPIEVPAASGADVGIAAPVTPSQVLASTLAQSQTPEQAGDVDDMVSAVVPGGTATTPATSAAADDGVEAGITVDAPEDGGGRVMKGFVPPELAAMAAERAGLREMIQAAAARIGRGPEVSAPGRRLGEVVVTAVSEGQSEAPVDGAPRGIALSELVRRAIDGAGEASTPDTAADSQGESAADALLAKTGAKSDAPLVTMSDLGPPALGGLEGRASAKAQLELAAGAAQSRIPESVSVRESGDAIIRSVRYLSGKTEETITVRLVPRSLGELQVSVRSGVNGVDVVLTASTAAAREAIEGQLAGLRQAMSGEGLDVNRVTVQVFGHFDAGHQAGPGAQGGQQGQAGQPARHAGPAYRDGAGAERGDRGTEQERRQRHEGRLNMWA